jgi:hypothetical protein
MVDDSSNASANASIVFEVKSSFLLKVEGSLLLEACKAGSLHLQSSDGIQAKGRDASLPHNRLTSLTPAKRRC